MINLGREDDVINCLLLLVVKLTRSAKLRIGEYLSLTAKSIKKQSTTIPPGIVSSFIVVQSLLSVLKLRKMLAVPSIKPSAPSLNLLRFLRSQSGSLFFTSNPANTKVKATVLTPCDGWMNRRTAKYKWMRLDQVPCAAKIEASFIPVWPAVKISTLQKSSRSRNPFSKKLETIRLNQPIYSSRGASLETIRCWHHWFKKAAYQKWKNTTPPPVTSFTDEGAEGNLFNLGRTLASKSLDEPRLRCTELDENGNVTLVNGEFRKSELIAKVGCPSIPVLPCYEK